MALRISIPLAEGEAHVDIDGDRLVVGRGRGADLRIPDVSVANRHIILEKRRTGYVLRTEPGTNACVLADGTQLAGGAEHTLQGDTWLAVGRVWVHIAPISETVPPHAKATRAMAELLMSHTLVARGDDTTPRLVVVAGKNTGDELLLGAAAQDWRIGRSEECDLVLRDVSVSRVHAAIVRDDAELFVVNEGAKQGSWLQGASLQPGERNPLRHGMVLRLANAELLFVDPIARALEDMEAAADLRVDPKHLPPPPKERERKADSVHHPDDSTQSMPPTLLAAAGTVKRRRSLKVEDVVIGAVGVAMLVASLMALRAIMAK